MAALYLSSSSTQRKLHAHKKMKLDASPVRLDVCKYQIFLSILHREKDLVEVSKFYSEKCQGDMVDNHRRLLMFTSTIGIVTKLNSHFFVDVGFQNY